MITLQQIKNFLNPFKGATSLSDGKKGLVPQPKIGDENKFLQGNGNWEVVDLTPLETAISNLQTNKSNITADNINVSSYLTTLGFTGTSKATNGYYKMPNGIIIQWGNSTTVSSEVDATITFPITFPNNCLNIIVGTCNPGTYPDRMMQLTSFNKSNAIIRSNSFNSAGGAQYGSYIAIGY